MKAGRKRRYKQAQALFAVFLLGYAPLLQAATNNPWGEPGEVVRYHYIDGHGRSIDMSYWPVNENLSKQLYIVNNEQFYERFAYSKRLKNTQGTSFSDIGADYYVVMLGCQRGWSIPGETQCLQQKNRSFAIVRRGLTGAYSVLHQESGSSTVGEAIFRFPRGRFDVSSLKLVEHKVESLRATSTPAGAFVERGARIRAANQKRVREAAAAEEARQAKLAAEKARKAKLKAEQERESQRRKAAKAREGSGDREPTQAEMNQAIRATVAGALFNASVTKLGSCRKAAPYDYYCRYRMFSVNWGNFWKQDGRWYFKIAN